MVGLNSAWLQFDDEDVERRIELFTQQLHCALGDTGAASPLNALDGRLCLLMLHHPPAWLSHGSSKRFHEEIYTPERFLICLHGHMHEARSETAAISGGQFRYYFQAPSLFGLEHYGTRGESRAMGYAWGELDASGAVRVWPMKRASQGGRQVFIWDTNFKEDPAGGHKIRPLFLSDTALPVRPSFNLRPWLTALVDRVGHIGISGIGSGVGRTKDALRYPIEQLYTTLRSRGEAMVPGDGSRTLADLLPKYPRLLIEGQPGAGKTTFLNLVATMLGRDWLGLPPPADGPSWRARYLALDERAPPRLPLLLKLSELALVLEQEPRTTGDDRRRLLALLDGHADAEPGKDWRRHWEGLLIRGEAILLLDGLDEVADEGLRDRVFAIFRDACEHWDKSPIVVTSRPIAVAAVKAMGFHHAVIEPFGEPEIRAFIERWVAALHNLPVGQRPDGEAGNKAEKILATVLTRPAIRRLAANPVMLTCLCVVHWNEGDLPDGRARLYKAVIRWLIAARTPQRRAAGFTNRFAHEAFATLALAMMNGAIGAGSRKPNKGDPGRTSALAAKVAIIDLETAAGVVVPLVMRSFPTENALVRARAWLRFECLWSGIVEERAGGRIAYWHLTFQEYLAAHALALLGDGETTADWWANIRRRLDELQWRETVDLFPGALIDEGGPRRVDTLLDRIAGLRGDSPTLAGEARLFGILGRLLAPMSAYDYPPKPEIEALLGTLRGRTLPVFGRLGAALVPAEVRIAAAEALGRGGDPRLAGDTMIELPGCGGVSLGKYPVTVQEFQGFVEAGGYDEQKYWSEAGWQIKVQREWSTPYDWERQTEHPNWPVTWVSWVEAAAWCNWRGRATGQMVRLPTEAEWQSAASPDGRRYPWGEAEPDPERANFGEKVGSPTPVGIYPAGNGPLGHCDLAGNVFEWGLDVGRDDQPVTEANPSAPVGDEMHVFRGGAWNTSADLVRTEVRSGCPSGLRAINLGFRCARVQGVRPAGTGDGGEVR